VSRQDRRRTNSVFGVIGVLLSALALTRSERAPPDPPPTPPDSRPSGSPSATALLELLVMPGLTLAIVLVRACHTERKFDPSRRDIDSLVRSRRSVWMWVFTEIANWWEEHRRSAGLSLEEYVENNPNQFAIIVATTTYTSMVIGSGVVDVLRLGDGVSEGNWKGVASDGLRLLGVAGPVGKGVQLLKEARHTRLARLIADPGGPCCGWVASTKALVQTGNRVNGRLLASVEDLAKALGVPMHQAGPLTLEGVASNLRALGANVGIVKKAQHIDDVARDLPRDGSAAIVGIRGYSRGQGVGHAVYVFKDLSGCTKVMDARAYTGRFLS